MARNLRTSTLVVVALLLAGATMPLLGSAESPTTLTHADGSAEGTFPVFHTSSVSFTYLRISFDVPERSFVTGVGGRYTSTADFDAGVTLAKTGTAASITYLVTFPANPSGGLVMMDLPGPQFLVTDGTFSIELVPSQGESDNWPLEQDSDRSGHTQFKADGATSWSPLDAEVAVSARIESVGALSVGAAATSGTLSPTDPVDLFAIVLPPSAPIVIDVTNANGADLKVRISKDDLTTGNDVISEGGSGAKVSLFTRSGTVDQPSLIRIDSDGLLSSAAYTVRVRVNGAPIAIGGGDRVSTVTVPIILDASASSDPDDDPLNVTWSFGGSEHLPPLAGSPATVTPTLVGELTIRLDISDGYELATSSFTISVRAKADITFSVSPQGSFDMGTIGQAVEFSARWSSDFVGDPNNATYTWDFGDGTTGQGQVISHAYASLPPSGTTVTIGLEAEYEGQSATESHQLRLNLPPEVSITRSGTGSVTVGDHVGFNASATDSDSIVVARFIWDFGDASLDRTTTAGKTDYVYTVAGNYTVLVTAQDSDGGNDNASVRIEVVAKSTGGGNGDDDGKNGPVGSMTFVIIFIAAIVAAAIVALLMLRTRRNKGAAPPPPPTADGTALPAGAAGQLQTATQYAPTQTAPPPQYAPAPMAPPPQYAPPTAPMAHPSPTYVTPPQGAHPPSPPQGAAPMGSVPPLQMQVDHGRQLRARQQAINGRVTAGSRLDPAELQRFDQLLSSAGQAIAAGNLLVSAQLLQQAENAMHHLERSAEMR